MELFDLDPHLDTRPGPGRRVRARGRASATGYFLAAIALGLAPVGVVVGAHEAIADLPWWTWIVGIPFLLLGGLIWFIVASALWDAAWATLRPTNWSVLVTERGLLIQLRHFANHHLSGPAQVLSIPFDELESARRFDLDRASLGRNDAWRATYLELELKTPVPPHVTEAVLAEARAKPPSRTRFGITSSGRVPGCPVSVADAAVRLAWPSASVRRALAEHVPFGEAKRERVATDRVEAPAEADDHVLELIVRGESVEASKLLRARYGMSIDEAQAFVDDLVPRRRAA